MLAKLIDRIKLLPLKGQHHEIFDNSIFPFISFLALPDIELYSLLISSKVHRYVYLRLLVLHQC